MKTNQLYSFRTIVIYTALGIGLGCGPRQTQAPEAILPNDSANRITAVHDDTVLSSQRGTATYYGPGLEGKKTYSGKTFHSKELVAAHPRYPMGTQVRVTNLKNDKAVEVEITDRGPTKKHQKAGVVIDLSKGAAQEIGLVAEGRAKVRVDVLEWGDGETR